MIAKRMQNLTPYTPGEQPQDRRYIKLNTNENPYPPAPEVTEALAGFECERLKRYPDPEFRRLRRAASDKYGIPTECIFAGNGSDEILGFSFYAFFDSVVTIPSLTYSFYPVYCDLLGIRCNRVSMAADFRVDLDALRTADACDGYAIANPNSPTGTYIERHRLKRFLEAIPKDRIILLDEAYIDFGGDSCVSLTRDFDNLVVVHTFSKSASLAGLRLGLAFGSRQLIDALYMVKNSFNSYPVHTMAQELGVLTLENWPYYEQIQRKIVQSRERVSAALRHENWKVIDSKSNFIFAKHPDETGETVYKRLKEEGILVRYFDTPDLNEYVRITIGTVEEMNALLDAAKRCS